jgi:hypothetical protein
MTDLEFLLLIFILIESCQLFALVYINFRTNRLWSDLMHDPEFAGEVFANALFGLLQDVAKDKGKQKVFFEFIALCGQAALGKAAGMLPQMKKKHVEWLNFGQALANIFGIDTAGMGQALNVATSVPNPVENPEAVVQQGIQSVSPPASSPPVEMDYGLAAPSPARPSRTRRRSRP